MRKLQEPLSGKIKKIFHISDIHIRNGNEKLSRFDEYLNVFTNLINILQESQEIKNHEAVIIVTGDTFHHKNKIESPGIYLFNYLISGLSSLAPIYIILGNHDFRQDQSVNIDFLDAFLLSCPNSNSNVEYLDKTGHYCSCNLIFGVFDVRDSLFLGNGSGVAENMEPFPQPIHNDETSINSINIALFHGTMMNSRINDNRILSHGYSWEWLDIGYDYALLGDIHKFQLFERKSGLVAGYAGSLVQQNYGETLKNHGFIAWDLETKTQDFIEVPNNYGFVKLNWKNSMMYVENDNILFEEILQNWSHCPKHLKIRITCTLSGEQRRDVINYLNGIEKENKITYEIEDISSYERSHKEKDQETFQFQFHSDIENELYDLMKVHNIEYKEPSIDEFTIPSNDAGKEIEKISDKKRNDLEKEIQKYSEYLENFKCRSSVHIKYFEWSGLLCYENQNWMDFTELHGKTNIISGRNGSGKTSFLEIINIAIFGKSIPSRKTKNSLKSIICRTKETNSQAYTKIDLYVQNEIFRIVRVFDNEGKIKPRSGGLFKICDGIWKKDFSDNARLNYWICHNIGDQNSFLISTMITQNNDSDFLSMDLKEQREYLEDVVGLTKVTKEVQIYKSGINSFKSILGYVSNSIETIGDDLKIHNLQDLEQKNKQHCENQTQYSINKEEIGSIQSKINILNDEILKISISDNYNPAKNSIAELDKTNETIHSLSDYENVNLLEEETVLLQNKVYLDNLQKSIQKYSNSHLNSNFNSHLNSNFNSNTIYHILNAYQKPILAKDECLLWIQEYDDFEQHYSESYIDSSKFEIMKEKYELDIDKLTFYQNQKFIGPCDPKIYYENDMKSLIKKRDELNIKLQGYSSLIATEEIPDVSKSTILSIQKEIKKEKKSNKNNSNEGASSQIREIQSNIQVLTNQNDILRQEMSHNEEEQLNMNDLLLKINFKIDKIRNDSNIKDSNYYRNGFYFLEKYNNKYLIFKMLKVGLNNKINHLQHIANQIEEHEKKIKFLHDTIEVLRNELSHLPFNPNCEACCKQPMRIQLTKMQDDYAQINSELSQLIAEKKNTSLISLERLIYLYEKFKEIVDNPYFLMKDEIYQKIKDIEKVDKYSDRRESIRAILMCYETRERELQRKINENENVLLEKNKELFCLEKHLENAKRWDEREAFIASYNARWYLYDRYLKYYQTNEELEKVLSDIGNFEKYEDFEKGENARKMNMQKVQYNISKFESVLIKRDIDDANRAINDVRYTKALQQLEEWEIYEAYVEKKEWIELYKLENHIYESEKRLSYKKEYDTNMIIKSDILNFLKKEELIEEKKNLEIEKEFLEKKLINLDVEVKTFEKMNEINRMKINRFTKLHELIDLISSKIKSFESRNHILDVYRSKTYNSVIPYLERMVNTMMETVSNSIHVKCDILQDGLFKFMAVKNNCEIPIEKTSGFERSLISLSIRLSLVFLSNSQNLRQCQLFIDEAFVNCDREHLEKVPGFLNSILSYFESIILVSHIDLIKDNVDNSIEIGEKNKIQYGDVCALKMRNR
tara:strand:+ start:7099 stop:11715 length:4617 start_codon:yes stop_codon:yes gene_type:complete